MINKIEVTGDWQELSVTGRYRNNSNISLMLQQSSNEPTTDGVVLKRHETIEIPDDGNKYWIKTTNGQTGEFIEDVVSIPSDSEGIFGSGSNYSEFESDGQLVAKGDATSWDDIRVSANNLKELGSNPPSWKLFKNNGGTPSPSYAVKFNGSGQYGKVSDYSSLDTDGTQKLSIEFWIVPNEKNIRILYRDNHFRIRIRNRALLVEVENSWELWTDAVFVDGVKTHIVVTFDYDGSTNNVNVYQDGTLVTTDNFYGENFTPHSSDLKIATETTQYDKLIIDELVMYNVELTQTQVTQQYNSGDGRVLLPTGITEATDVIAWFHFDENTGSTVDNACTLGAGHDMTLYSNPEWVDGLVGSNSIYNLGTVALAFSGSNNNEVFFSCQLPHTMKENSIIYPHVHFVPSSNNSGTVVWKLEYVWANVHSQFSNTSEIILDSINTSVDNQKDYHLVAENVNGIEPDITSQGKISSMIMCRLYRDAENDTYPDDVSMLEFDFHIEIDTQGSKTEWSKDGTPHA